MYQQVEPHGKLYSLLQRVSSVIRLHEFRVADFADDSAIMEHFVQDFLRMSEQSQLCLTGLVCITRTDVHVDRHVVVCNRLTPVGESALAAVSAGWVWDVQAGGINGEITRTFWLDHLKQRTISDTLFQQAANIAAVELLDVKNQFVLRKLSSLSDGRGSWSFNHE